MQDGTGSGRLSSKGDEMADLALLALTRDRAAALTGLSRRQLDYWDQTGLIRPTVAERVTPGRVVRLYEYQELMSLLVVSELRRRGVALQVIRRIVAHLRERGYSQPLTQLRYATDDSTVYFQHDDGSWESNLRADQVVLTEVVDLAPLAARLQAAGDRDPSTYGQFDRRRGALGSKPVIAGTRIPVETVRRYLDHGASVRDVLDAYPSLVPEDVEAVRHATVA